MGNHYFSPANPNKTLAFCVISLIIAAVLFVSFEGIGNVIRVVKSLHPPIAERIHTKYDEQLGWVNIPNTAIQNMYGDGIYFRTNARGFRGNTDFSVSVPKGKVRVIASGDSFTLGYGVDNDHTWCQLLASLDERLEVVNMGQGGYGIDQSYLWYMRDGIKLEHQFQIFAIIGGDFGRFGKSFLGYGKPYLEIQNGSFSVRNVPVPKRPYYVPWLTENIGVIDELKTVRMMRAAGKRLARGGKLPVIYEFDDELKITLKIFEELLIANKLKNSTLIVAYLPGIEDLDETGNPEVRRFLRAELSKRNIIFLDLVDEFREIPVTERSGLFIQKSNRYLGEGHYTVKGNQYVAGMIYNKLLPCFDSVIMSRI
jgi:hypothetical protein